MGKDILTVARPDFSIESKLSPKIRERSFPENAVEREKLLLSCVNSSTKAAVLMLLSRVETMTLKDLVHNFRELYSGTPLAGFKETAIRQLCICNFCKWGLVSMSVTPDGDTKFALTSSGRTYSPLIASKYLYFENQTGIGLRTVLGSSSSINSQDQTCYTRSRIIKFLNGKQGVVREAEIRQQLGIPPAVASYSLERLADCGVVNYLAIDPNRRVVKASFLGSIGFGERSILEIPIDRASILVEAIRQNGNLESSSIGGNDDLVKIASNPIIRQLIDQNVLILRQPQTYFSIADSGRIVAQAFLNSIEKVANDDGFEMSQIRKGVVPTVLANLKEFVIFSAPLYFRESYSKKIREHAKNRATILFKLGLSPNGRSSKELALAIDLHPQTVDKLLQPLVKEGHIMKFKLRNTNRFVLSRNADVSSRTVKALTSRIVSQET